MRKKLLILLGTLVSAFLVHVSFIPLIISERISHDMPNNLEFSFESCDDNDTNLKDTISTHFWQDDVLEIKGEAHPNCGAVWLYGNYKIKDNNKLVLGYKSLSPFSYACSCTKRVVYRIHNLEMKTYDITLMEYEEVGRMPYFYQWWFDVPEKMANLRYTSSDW